MDGNDPDLRGLRPGVRTALAHRIRNRIAPHRTPPHGTVLHLRAHVGRRVQLQRVVVICSELLSGHCSICCPTPLIRRADRARLTLAGAVRAACTPRVRPQRQCRHWIAIGGSDARVQAPLHSSRDLRRKKIQICDFTSDIRFAPRARSAQSAGCARAPSENRNASRLSVRRDAVSGPLSLWERGNANPSHNFRRASCR